MQHNMQLLDIRLLNLEFHINRDYKEEAEKTSLKTDIGTKHEFNSTNNELIVLIRVRLETGNSPYFFQIESGGHFKFNLTPDPKILENFATINCPAIIFPYVRETIADLTRRAGFPPLHIGPINFVELATQSKKESLEEKVSSPE